MRDGLNDASSLGCLVEVNLNYSAQRLHDEETAISLLQRDKHLVEMPLARIIKKPTAQKQAWLHMMKLAQSEQDNVHANETATQANSMHSFLTTYAQTHIPWSRVPKQRVSTRQGKKPRLFQSIPKASSNTNFPKTKRTVRKKLRRIKDSQRKNLTQPCDDNKWNTNREKESSICKGSWRQP